MRLIDKLLSSSQLDVEVAAEVRADNVFYDAAKGGVPAWTGIEYMAQTAAVWVGLEDSRAGKKIEPAFLISTRQYTAHCPQFELGESLRVCVHVNLIDGSLVAFNGAIYSAHNADNRLLAEAVFTAYRPDDVAAYLAAAEPELTQGVIP